MMADGMIGRKQQVCQSTSELRQPNRFHAACRDTASVFPIAAQLTSRTRRMSTTSCMAAPTDSKAPLYPARVFSNFSVGALSGRSEFSAPRVFGFSAIIGRQSSTHSSQIKTPGPVMSFFTSVCDFPQKEQRNTRLGALVVFAFDTGHLHRQTDDDSQLYIDTIVNIKLTFARTTCDRMNPFRHFANLNCRTAKV
jgi:hypothetical protein